MLNVFIGHDRDEDNSTRVAVRSLLAHADKPVNVQLLKLDMLRRAGLYTRQTYLHGKQRYDTVDLRPYSTEFSFTRFLVPALMQWQGSAIFMDSDVLLRDDINKLYETWHNPDMAVQCVQHAYNPVEEKKLRYNIVQSPYQRKNWSSVMLFNCSHDICQMLLPQMVNTADGRFLQTLQWCPTPYIGALGNRWNWLEGHSSDDIDPALVHYTRGVPDVPGYEDAPYADEWRSYL